MKTWKKGHFYYLSSLLINNSTNIFTKFLEGRNQPKKIYMINNTLKTLQCNTNIYKMELTYFINKLLWNLLVNTIKVVSFTWIWGSWTLNKEILKEKISVERLITKMISTRMKISKKYDFFRSKEENGKKKEHGALKNLVN